ncbi:MarR family winged helix-turn-helix transcriptional regulator [Paenibacillus polymyxa]|uniref:MarR family winged helix-turn-helix transcriptional regulator n=1 Tax=Paenibacillus polymyxa TaxID=1406 RepID=UPI002023F8B1|nr:MarR family winged helix-turn-helix transcriptional regulator [Paenibacillus polymyxa]MDU8674294.1 MarR family winged helix-turn-helix transcriptional regulator [Paenibacillus polymyxa]MDU8699202.1 MarR family winged helix-turn-helix transcriptional regulator [Paenibacillus polymyxa]URJ53871.1 MarR family winged helix-turn-helix transcriptional regulator [Paenibacillus polymyxa]URJ65718.1 MarR family winged helix-turn-helix transcriptional regulator [Paenibacillus polymyxa]URJ68380.1 MarR f
MTASRKDKQTSQNNSPSVCTCINLRRASMAVTGLYDQYLAPSGLHISQFSLLKHLTVLGPVSVSELASEMRLDRTTLVRNLKALEQSRYVEDTSAEGSRNRCLTLTGRGKALYNDAAELWEEAQLFLQESLGSADLQILTALLSKIEKLRL